MSRFLDVDLLDVNFLDPRKLHVKLLDVKLLVSKIGCQHFWMLNLLDVKFFGC